MTDPALAIFPDEYVPNEESSNGHKAWVKSNPGEAAKWARFRDDVIAGKEVTPPVLATKHGKALVAAGKEHMSITHFVGHAIPVPSPVVTVPSYYGVPIGSIGLGNLEIGKFNRQVAHRFRADYTDTLTSVNCYLKNDGAAGVYSFGNGGDIRLDLYAADGSGHPTGPSLANSTVFTPMTSQFWNFTLGAAVTQGTIYCLVWTNTDVAQATNYVSLNNTNIPSGLTPRQAYAPDTDVAVFYRDGGSGPWNADHVGYTPLSTIFYAGGQKQGNGYMDYRSSSGLLAIGGNTLARMNITPTSVRTLRNIFVWTQKSGSPTALNVTIKQGAATIHTATIPAASVATSYAWASAALSSTWTTQIGVNVTVELSASTGTYNTFPYQSGESAGFSGGLLFSDGYYEFSTNGGGAWSTYSGSTAFDIPIYLTA